MVEIPPPREQTDRQTLTTENITFATPLAEGNDVDKGPFIAKEINRDSESECILWWCTNNKKVKITSFKKFSDKST